MDVQVLPGASLSNLTLMAVIQLVYVSAAKKPVSQIELADLLLRARKNNSSLNITGLLLYHNLSFFQILEGDDAMLAPLYARIQGDPRHDRVVFALEARGDRTQFRRDQAVAEGFRVL